MKSVPKDISFKDFLDVVYNKISVDKRRFNLELCTSVDAQGSVCYPKISNDEDIVCMMNSTKKMPVIYAKVVQRTVFVTEQEVGGEEGGDYDNIVNEIFGDHDTNVIDEHEDSDDSEEEVDDDDDDDDDGNCRNDNLNWNYSLSPRRNVGLLQNDIFSRIPGSENFSLVPISNKVSCPPTRRYFDRGELFQSKDDMKCKLHLYALNQRFEIRIKRSSKIEFIARCKNNNCSFRFRATKLSDSEYWEVAHFVETHSCSVNVFDSRQRTTSSKVIGRLMAPRLSFSGVALKPIDIVASMRLQWGIEIPYTKAWMAKEHAEASVFGDANESFKILSSYFYMLENKNPGTVTALKTDDMNRFEHCFWMYGAAINGFRFARPVIAIDGTFLKGRFKGILFVAVGIDSNEQTYPLAFGIGHKEEISSWSWFLSQLRRSIGSPSGLMFISDQHAAIRAACEMIYPEVPHGLCTYHLKSKLRSKVNGKTVVKLYKKAYKAYSRLDFDNRMEALRECNSRAHAALLTIGVERWARCHSPRRRFNIMTSNIAESMNSCLKHARQMPVVILLDFVRDLFQRWYHERREFARSLTTFLTPYATKIVDTCHDQAHYMEVFPINTFEFQVKHTEGEELVNLKDKTCTCCMFQSIMLPCLHAAAAISKQKIPYVPFCSEYYHKTQYIEMYRDCVYPVGNIQTWDVPEEVESRDILPPSWFGGQAGRPRHRRYSVGKQRHCKLCHALGHNRRTCTNPTGAPAKDKKINPKKKIRKQYSCSYCKEVGHKRNVCPSRSSNDVNDVNEDIDLEID